MIESSWIRTAERQRRTLANDEQVTIGEDLIERLQKVMGKSRIQVLRLTNPSLTSSGRRIPENESM